jgi:TolA-binding protein
MKKLRAGGSPLFRATCPADSTEERKNMSIGAVTPNIASNGNHLRPERQDLQQVQKALNSGDLAGAQQAFAQFKQDFHAAHNGRALFQTGVSDTLKQDLETLQSALKSGDLAGAQQAFTQFKADFKAQQGPPKEPPVSAQSDSNGSGASNGSINVLA